MNYRMSDAKTKSSVSAAKNLEAISCRVTFVGNYATMSLEVQIWCGNRNSIEGLAIKEAESLALEYYGIDIPESGLSAVETVVELIE